MAKIENYTLDTLQKVEENLKQQVLSAKHAAEAAEINYNKFMADKDTAENHLKNVQDSIELLLTPAPKKKAKNDTKN